MDDLFRKHAELFVDLLSGDYKPTARQEARALVIRQATIAAYGYAAFQLWTSDHKWTAALLAAAATWSTLQWILINKIAQKVIDYKLIKPRRQAAEQQ